MGSEGWSLIVHDSRGNFEETRWFKVYNEIPYNETDNDDSSKFPFALGVLYYHFCNYTHTYVSLSIKRLKKRDPLGEKG